MKNKNAYLTVYMTLSLILIIALMQVFIDGVRRNGVRLEAVCVSEAGLQSILAEYHRGLAERYNIFAVDSSYGSQQCGKKVTESHLLNYLRKNTDCQNVILADYFYRDMLGIVVQDATLTGVSILTDGAGAVFRGCAVDAYESDIGLNYLEELQQWMYTIEVNGLDTADTDEIKEDMDRELQEINGREIELSEEEIINVHVDNPTSALDNKLQLGILHLMVPNEQNLSGKFLDESLLLSTRMEQEKTNLGELQFEGRDSITDRFFFQEYLMKYCGNYRNIKDGGALDYQIEYLISGKEKDIDCLQGVLTRIYAIREASNVLYLMSDQNKKMEIQTAATMLGGAIPVPGLVALLEGIILIGWASAESIYDVKTLLEGYKIPLIKNSDSWHYGLYEALGGETGAVGQESEGLSYEDYLCVLMMMTSLDRLTMRAMNIVEMDIRLMQGNQFFRLDGCFAVIEATISFSSSFGYQYELTRKKRY